MFKISPLSLGIIYLLMATLFINVAISIVSNDGWTFISGVTIFFATINTVSGIRFIQLHIRIAAEKRKKG